MWSHPSSSLSQCSAMFSTPAEHVGEKYLAHRQCEEQQDQIMRSHCGNPAPALLQESDTVWHPPTNIYVPLDFEWTHLWWTSIAEAMVSNPDFFRPSCDTWLRSPFPFSMAEGILDDFSKRAVSDWEIWMKVSTYGCKSGHFTKDRHPYLMLFARGYQNLSS